MHSMRKASEVRKTEPILWRLRILSNTTTKGSFSASLNSSTLSTIQSTYGSYAVFGNHDVTERLLGGFSVTSKENEVRDPRFESFLKDADITLLDDKVTCIDNAFYLVGRKDIQKPGDGTTNRKTIEELLSNVDKTKPVFVLEHQPKQLEELDNAGVDMQLCGHTHDGQIFPGNLTVKLFWENPCGYLDRKSTRLNSSHP